MTIFEKGQYSKALACFKKFQTYRPDDKVCAYYISLLENFFMKGNDGRFILNSESGVYSKTANFMNVAKTGGAGIVAGNNDELKEQILENELDDPLRNSESKYLINRFYYGSSGYGHKRYDLKYLKNDWKSLTIFRSLKPMSEPKTGIKNRLYFYTGRR